MTPGSRSFQRPLKAPKMLLQHQLIFPETESGLVPVMVNRAVKGAEIACCDHSFREVIPATDIHNCQCYESLQDSELLSSTILIGCKVHLYR